MSQLNINSISIDGKVGECLNYYYFIRILNLDTVIKELGKGGFGIVILCMSTVKNPGNFYAIKCIDSSKCYFDTEKEEEFGYKSQLSSSYLVKYYETFIFNNFICFVVEYFEKGSLDNLINEHLKMNKKISKEVFKFS
jgi:serine/threonine protein kinase